MFGQYPFKTEAAAETPAPIVVGLFPVVSRESQV
jgi:hypothetical protein